MEIGDIIQVKINNKLVTGEIVNIYVVPKDYNLVDILVDGQIIYGVSTENAQVVNAA